MHKSGLISWYAIVNRSLSVLIGPITVFFISQKLTTEEIAFYYTFFNLIALQQLAELGIGHTIKQHVAHALEYEHDILTEVSKRKISSYFNFSKKWFGYLSLFILFVVGCAGEVYYNDYVGMIEWQKPWWCLIAIAFVSIRYLPFQLVSEACQRQILVFKSQFIATLISSVSLWLALMYDFGLYSVAISFFVNTLIVNVLVILKQKELFRELDNYNTSTFLSVFKEIWPLLHKVSVVWGVGFLFWNGINLISFKVFDKNHAGMVIFTFTVVKMIFNVAETVVSSQMTVWSKMIANNELNTVSIIFKKYRNMSVFMYLFAFLILFLLKYWFGEIGFLSKILNSEQLIQFGFFFFLLLYLTTSNNLVRCLKIEPFMYVSIFHSLLVPALFYVSVCLGFYYFLFPSCIVLIISLLVSRKISNRLIADN